MRKDSIRRECNKEDINVRQGQMKQTTIERKMDSVQQRQTIQTIVERTSDSVRQRQMM